MFFTLTEKLALGGWKLRASCYLLPLNVIPSHTPTAWNATLGVKHRNEDNVLGAGDHLHIIKPVSLATPRRPALACHKSERAYYELVGTACRWQLADGCSLVPAMDAGRSFNRDILHCTQGRYRRCRRPEACPGVKGDNC